MSIDAMRRDYDAGSLDVSDVDPDPIIQFQLWFDQIVAYLRRDGAPRSWEANAMTLATCDADGAPDARIVLLKGVSAEGFAFYTNQTSAKAEQLAANPRAALVFHWDPLDRQVRIRGTIRKMDRAAAEPYFASRPRGSQLGAWVSQQSKAIASREALEVEVAKITARFEGQDVPMPEFWGGYVMEARSIEFWQGRTSRLHDRVAYRRNESEPDTSWTIERLAP